MKDHFKPTKFDVQSEFSLDQTPDQAGQSGETGSPVKGASKLRDVRVLKLDLPKSPGIQEFEYTQIREQGKGQYDTVKKKFGPLAATDAERSAKAQKEARFSMSGLLKNPLGVQQEEQRVIEEEVVRRVNEIRETARQDGFQQGLDEGLRLGKAQAYEEARVESTIQLGKFTSFLNGCENAREEIFKANESFLMETLAKLTQRVILKELESDRTYITRVAKDLVENVKSREYVRLQVNADDFEAAGKIRENLEKELGELKNMTIEVNEDIELGGCMVETDLNAVDATLEAQLQRVFESWTGKKQIVAEAGSPQVENKNE